MENLFKLGFTLDCKCRMVERSYLGLTQSSTERFTHVRIKEIAMFNVAQVWCEAYKYKRCVAAISIILMLLLII